MEHACTLVTYMLLLIISLLIYCAEVSLHVLTAVQLYLDQQYIWFSLQAGLLLVPTVTAQFVSTYQSWDTFDWACSRAIWCALHVFQMAIPSRYLRLLLYCGTVDVQQELAQSCQLRSFLVFSSSLPLALLEVYIVFTDALPTVHNRITMTAAAFAVFSAACTLSSFRKRDTDYRYLETMVSWPGTVFKFIWKLGELACRIVFLSLFTKLYTVWIFLVLLCHWICMLLSLVLELQLRADKTSKKSALRILATSYTYIFCYLNVTTKPEKYRFLVFYLIMSVENALLLLLWLMYDVRDYLHLPVAVATSVVFVAALISAMFYYNCFHVKSSDKLPLTNETNYIQQCINCKLSLCVKHDQCYQRPYNAAWWMEVQPTQSDQDSADYFNPSEYMINSKALTPGVKTAVLVPVHDTDSQGNQQLKYFKYYKDIMDSVSMNSASSSYLIPYREPSGDSVSDSYAWDDYDVNDQELDDELDHELDNSSPDALDDDGNEEPPSTDTGTQARDSQKPSDSGFSASTSSRSGSRLSPFSQGEYVLYISDNDDSDFSTSFVSSEPGRPRRYYLSDQWSVTTSTTENTVDRWPSRRLLYRLPGGLARLQETKGNRGKHRDNIGFAPNPEDGRVVLFPMKMCRNCGSSSTSSPSASLDRRDRPPARKPISERMLAERRRARKQRMATAKMVSRSRQHFKSQMAQLRRKMESSGMSDADCSVVGVAVRASGRNKAASKGNHQNKPSDISTDTSATQETKTKKHKSTKDKKDSKNAEVKHKKKAWELTPENSIMQLRSKKKPRNLSPAGFEVQFEGQNRISEDTSIEIETKSATNPDDTLTI